MQRWLYHCEVEAHVCLAEGEGRLECQHPSGHYKLILENKAVTPGGEVPLLDAYVILDADDLETAITVARGYLREALETLVFATGFRLRHHRDVIICDWSRGIESREARVYNAAPPPNFPIRALVPELMGTLRTLLERDRPEAVRRTLRWYSNGVSAGPPDEQFEWFWLAIEVLAQFTRNVEPVPDLCPRCRGELFCKACNEMPKHRPYPRQAILALLRQHAGNEAEDLFDDASAFRNALMHGEPLKAVQEERGKSIDEVVDRLGQVAWKALGIFLLPTSVDSPERAIAILSPSTYLNRRLRVTAQVAFGSPTDREPELTDIPKMDITVIHGGSEQAK